MAYADRVTFQTPDTESSNGIIQDLSERGVLLLTVDRLPLKAEIELNLTLTVGKNDMTCVVMGTIEKLDPNVRRPLIGYRVRFSPKTPPATFVTLRRVTHQTKEEMRKAADDAKLSAALQAAANASENTPPEGIEAPKEAEADVLAAIDAKPSTGPARSFPMLPILLVALVVAVSGVFGFRFWQQTSIGAIFKGTIPVRSIEDVYGTLIVRVNPEWIVKTSSDEKRGQLRRVAQALVARNLNGASFRNESGVEIAFVTLPKGGKPDLARIGGPVFDAP